MKIKKIPPLQKSLKGS